MKTEEKLAVLLLGFVVAISAYFIVFEWSIKQGVESNVAGFYALIAFIAVMAFFLGTLSFRGRI